MAERSNCVGYTLHVIGLETRERYIKPKPLAKYKKLVEASLDTAELLAVEVIPKDRIVHMAAFDPQDRDYVLDRAGYGKPRRRVRLEDCLDPYNIREGGPRVVFLKRK